MDSFIFSQRIKVGKLDLHPGVIYGFEDPDAVPYFEACGWGDRSSDDPALALGIDEIDIDPVTIFGTGPDRGKYVMPDRAAAALGITTEEAQAFVAGPGAV